MGCMWSCEISDRDSGEVRTYDTSRYLNRPRTQIELKPYFGEYKCPACGRSWCSRLSWPNRYQVCNCCKIHVFAHNMRELRPSDMGPSKTTQEHKKDLCQMCQQLGYYCGNLKKNKTLMRK